MCTDIFHLLKNDLRNKLLNYRNCTGSFIRGALVTNKDVVEAANVAYIM